MICHFIVSKALGIVVEERTKAQALTHGSSRSYVGKTCFLVGSYDIESMYGNLWVTVSHGNGRVGSELVIDQLVSIHLGNKKSLDNCKCVFVDNDSDIAVIASPRDLKLPIFFRLVISRV